MKVLKSLNILANIAEMDILLFQVLQQVLVQDTQTEVTKENTAQHFKKSSIKGGFATFTIFNQNFKKWKHQQQ